MFLPPPRGTNAPTAVGSSRPTPDPKGGKALVLSLKDDKLQREEREKHTNKPREKERENNGAKVPVTEGLKGRKRPAGRVGSALLS